MDFLVFDVIIVIFCGRGIFVEIKNTAKLLVKNKYISLIISEKKEKIYTIII